MWIVSSLAIAKKILLVISNELIRVESLSVLTVVTVVDRVEHHSAMTTGRRSLLAVCRVLTCEELLATSTWWTQRRQCRGSGRLQPGAASTGP